MKKVIGILSLITIILLISSSWIVNEIVQIKPPFGIIAVGDRSSWIGFYGSIVGGLVTFLGVIITIFYTRELDKEKSIESVRPRLQIYKKDQSGKPALYQNEILIKNDNSDISNGIIGFILINEGCNTCLNLEINKIVINNDEFKVDVKLDKDYLYKKLSIDVGKILIFSLASNKPIEDEINLCVMDVNYFDIQGRKYVQTIYFDFSKNNDIYILIYLN